MTTLSTPTSVVESSTGPATVKFSGRRPRRAASAGTATGPHADPAGGARGEPPVTTDQLLRARSRLPAGHPDRAVLRAWAIEGSLALSARLARRYAGRGERLDDLLQVAALALIKAVDRYDPDRGSPFVAYAAPTIVGAIKRHFRDATWAMRVPRSTQELLLSLPAVTGHLTQTSGRPPTSAELAGHLDVTTDVLLATIHAGQVYRLPSLNAPAGGDDAAEVIDLIGTADPRFESVEDQLIVRELLARLRPYERRILTMRFYNEMTQSQIAAEIGVSQMQVSRLLRKILARLRVALPVPSGASSDA